jgi:cold shock CspA family protein
VEQGVIRKIAIDRETGKYKGFGFIKCNRTGIDYFFHRDALPRGVRLDTLVEGQTVEFEPDTPGEKGERVKRLVTA